MFLTRPLQLPCALPDGQQALQFSVSGQSATSDSSSPRSPATIVRGVPHNLAAHPGGIPTTCIRPFPSNTKEYPRCAEAHLGYHVLHPNRLHTGWGLVSRRRDARLSGQSCPGAGTSPGGQGHTGLTRSSNRVKRVRCEHLKNCLRLTLRASITQPKALPTMQPSAVTGADNGVRRRGLWVTQRHPPCSTDPPPEPTRQPLVQPDLQSSPKRQPARLGGRFTYRQMPAVYPDRPTRSDGNQWTPGAPPPWSMPIPAVAYAQSDRMTLSACALGTTDLAFDATNTVGAAVKGQLPTPGPRAGHQETDAGCLPGGRGQASLTTCQNYVNGADPSDCL